MNELNRQEAEALAEKWLNGSITPEEEQRFFQWYNANQHKDTQLPEGFAADEAALGQRMFAAIQARNQKAAPLASVPDTRPVHQQVTHSMAPAYRTRLLRRLSAAAILLLIAGGGWWLIRKPSPASPLVVQTHTASPTGVILTLTNGEQMVLDSMPRTYIEEQGAVIALEGDRLMYTGAPETDADSNHTVMVGNNTIATPAGKLFRVILPDGSKVWLNALSRLSYPIAFTGANRTVALNGEAYFEIAPDAQKPFFVTTADATIQVLGTSFNIMAYADEPQMRTTLLSGKIGLMPAGVTTGNAGAAPSSTTGKQPAITLQPGQQAVRMATGFTIHSTDAEEAIAWKNGYFQLDHARLPDIMRQLARWYNVEIVYQGQIPAEEFSGQIERSAGIEQVLKVLALKQVHFTVEGNKIIVHP